MKIQFSSLSQGGFISNCRASAYVQALMCPRDPRLVFAFPLIASHEELQIVYANLRV